MADDQIDDTDRINLTHVILTGLLGVIMAWCLRGSERLPEAIRPQQVLCVAQTIVSIRLQIEGAQCDQIEHNQGSQCVLFAIR